jgi:hypothetical protein
VSADEVTWCVQPTGDREMDAMKAITTVLESMYPVGFSSIPEEGIAQNRAVRRRILEWVMSREQAT